MSLLDAAKAVRANAYVPYSHFAVGAAVRSASGRVFVGCNVENVSYPEGTCAEAGAIAAMVAAGETEIAEVTVVAGGSQPVAPCGGCRQKLLEFATEGLVVTMATMDGQTLQRPLEELMPGAFSAAQME